MVDTTSSRRSRPRAARWARLLAAAGLIAALEVASLARAEGGAPGRETGAQTSPPPRPGTYRLIHIGPQVDIVEDAHGRFRMADEPPPKRSPGRTVITVLFGVVLAGAVLTLGRNELTTDVGGRAPGPP